MICTLCPRHCGVDRRLQKGFCGLPEEMLLARTAPHLWEEPPISGTRGTGALFFSGCTLRCAYCQNGDISHRNQGSVFTPQALADSMKRLEDLGMQSISFITATPYVPQILQALELYRPSLPLVWNTSGYETPEILERLSGVMDVYLPDLKHWSENMGRLCAKAPDYFAVTSKAIQIMCSQTGKPVYQQDGIMRRGVLIRHLILPGLTGESMKLLTWVRDTLGTDFPVSLMRQYIPCNNVSIPGLNRRISEKEYVRVRDHMIALGLEGFLQEPDSADRDFIPLFNQKESFV